MKKGTLISIIVAICIVGSASVLLTIITKNKNMEAPFIKNIELLHYEEDKNLATIKAMISTNRTDKIECIVKDSNVAPASDEHWILANDNTCQFDVEVKDPYLFLKIKDQVLAKSYRILEYLPSVSSLNLDNPIIYLPLNEQTTLNPNMIAIQENVELTWTSSDEKIAKVENGIVTGLALGEVTITVSSKDGISDSTQVIVTDLITGPILNSNKPFLACKQYTNSEAILLDKILENRVEEAGYQTRAGVLAAARFLLLEFKQRVNYFSENGRLNNYDGIAYVDGEGRYYHKGLYLSEDKYKDIAASKTGPAMWGCDLEITHSEEDQFAGNMYPNGLDCSAFVTWVLLNGGFDVGDSGAGDVLYRDDDVSDLGEKHAISYSLLKSGKVKAGDLIGISGHAAIIIGMDDEHVYVAETLFYNTGTNILTFTYDQLANTNYFTYILLMDEVYKEQGNYTNMW